MTEEKIVIKDWVCLKEKYEISWEGYQCFIHDDKCDLDDKELFKRYDIVISYLKVDENWNFALRTMKYEGLDDKKIDVDTLACKYGGRGHNTMHYYHKTCPAEAFITFEHFPWMFYDKQLLQCAISMRSGK